MEKTRHSLWYRWFRLRWAVRTVEVEEPCADARAMEVVQRCKLHALPLQAQAALEKEE